MSNDISGTYGEGYPTDAPTGAPSTVPPEIHIMTPLTPGACMAYGMTLRDWFAGMATEAEIESFFPGWNPNRPDLKECERRIVARYAFADAMMAERERSKP